MQTASLGPDPLWREVRAPRGHSLAVAVTAGPAGKEGGVRGEQLCPGHPSGWKREDRKRGQPSPAQPHRMEFGSILRWAGVRLSFYPPLLMSAWEEATGEGALPQTQHPSSQGVHLGLGVPASCPVSTCPLNRTASFPSRGRGGRSELLLLQIPAISGRGEGAIPRLCEVRGSTSWPPTLQDPPPRTLLC